MKAIYYQNGNTIDYSNTTENVIEFNTVVVVGKKIGVTSAPILPGTTGSLHMVGVFKMTKVANEAIEAGTTVYFTGEAITATATDNTLAGYTVKAASSADTEVYVKLEG